MNRVTDAKILSKIKRKRSSWQIIKIEQEQIQGEG